MHSYNFKVLSNTIASHPRRNSRPGYSELYVRRLNPMTLICMSSFFLFLREKASIHQKRCQAKSKSQFSSFEFKYSSKSGADGEDHCSLDPLASACPVQ